MKPLALVALVVLGCGAAWAEGLVTEARAIAGRGGLLEAACAGQDDRTLPAYFSYGRRDDLHVAEAAILLPVPVADAAEVIDRVEGYPAWALTAEDGSSVLHELGFDTVTGRGQVRLDDSEEGLFEGVLSRRTGDVGGMRIEMLGGKQIKDVAIEVVTFPPRGCADASVVTLRMTWRPRLLARVFAGGMLVVPATFVLAIRDDLAGHLLLRSDAAPTIVGVPLEDGDGRRIVGETAEAAPDKAGLRAGDELLRLEPAVLRLGEEQREALGRLVNNNKKKPSQKELFDLVFQVLSGRHRITGFGVTVASGEEPRTFFKTVEEGNVCYGVKLDRVEDGFSLGVSLSPLSPSKGCPLIR